MWLSQFSEMFLIYGRYVLIWYKYFNNSLYFINRSKKKKGRKRNKSSTTKTEFGFYGIGFLCGPDEEYTRQRQESESSQLSDTEIYYGK